MTEQKPVGALWQGPPAPEFTFTITRKDLGIEEVHACFVEFTAHHVIFRDTDGKITYGLRSDLLIDITQEDAS